MGLNLQKAATVCINLELPWNPAVLEQRIGRIYRIGQEDPIQVFNLVTRNSIEDRIFRLVGQKKAVFDALFKGDSDEVILDEKSSFYEQVNQIIADPEPSQSVANVPLISEDLSHGDDVGIHSDDPEVPSERSLVTSGEPDLPALLDVFKGIKIEQKDNGALKIEADGDAAKLLSGMFQQMANIFAGQR